MKKLLLVVLMACAATLAPAQTKLTTFILVRHAEKAADGTDNPPLKPEGQERATRLAQLLAQTKVDVIYSTPFKRTRETVTPLATAKQLPVQEYDPAKKDEVLTMLKKHAGGTVVVAGHSNTVPRMANTLTGTDQYKDFADDDFGNIIIITVTEKAATYTVTWLRY